MTQEETNKNIQRWHKAYQKALLLSSTKRDGVVRAFERIVGNPPSPSNDEGYAIYEKLLMDLRQMEDFEQRYPEAIVAFGGARLKHGEPYYALAMEVGERLARMGFLVRTGAGPGIMDAVPLGFKSELSRTPWVDSDHHLTQGVRIELPFESVVSSSIDINTMMKTFAIRRTALIWNSRGIAVFPGGLGTISEMLEAWVGAIDNKVACPIVMIPGSFYLPFLESLYHVAVARGTIHPNCFGLIDNATNAEEAMELLTKPMRPKAPGTQLTLREKLIYLRHELGRGLSAVSSLCPALSFIGSNHSLGRDDAEVHFVGILARAILASTNFGIRLGGRGAIEEVITASAENSNSYCEDGKGRIQRVLMAEDMAADSEHGSDPSSHVNAHFESRVAYKETLIHNTVAAFFLPCDLCSLDVLFALLCEIQTERRRPIPIFLVGQEFWSPILHGLQQSLRGDFDGQYINYSDLDMLRIIGTTADDELFAIDVINNLTQ